MVQKYGGSSVADVDKIRLVAQRIARTLVRLARESGRSVAGGTLIDQPLGRQEIADLSGASMYTASRLLAGWAREGILDVGRQRVTIRSLERLEKLAEGAEGAEAGRRA